MFYFTDTFVHHLQQNNWIGLGNQNIKYPAAFADLINFQFENIFLPGSAKITKIEILSPQQIQASM